MPVLNIKYEQMSQGMAGALALPLRRVQSQAKAHGPREAKRTWLTGACLFRGILVPARSVLELPASGLYEFLIGQPITWKPLAL